MKKTKLIIIVGFLLGFFNLNSQDLVFSQFYNAPLVLNPAFAGNSTDAQFSANYRLQWPNVPNAYESFALGYNQYLNRIKSGIGVSVISDSSGDGAIEHLNVGLTYMYKLQFRNDYQLKIGIETAFAQNRLDWNKLVFPDQLDLPTFLAGGGNLTSNEIPPESFNKAYLDLSTGLLFYNKSYFVGFTMKHFNNPNNGFINRDNSNRLGLPLLFNLHVGYQYLISPGNKRQNASFISPSLLVARQADYYQINIGSYIQLKSLIGGLYFRHTVANGDAIIFAAGANLDKIKLTYSYDYTVSGQYSGFGGSHELGIIYNLPNSRQQESKLNDCLQLFR